MRRESLELQYESAADGPKDALWRRRTATLAGYATLLLLVASLVACGGVIFGGEFPLSAVLSCMLLWPLALLSGAVWVVAARKL